MSIIITGLEMPTERESFNLTIKYNGTVLDTETGMQVAEAHELPPHGRLIDARYIRDAIIQKWMDKAGDSHMYKCGMEDAYEVIRNAPTIIQAEGEKT